MHFFVINLFLSIAVFATGKNHRHQQLNCQSTLLSLHLIKIFTAIKCPDQGSIRNGFIECDLDNDYTSHCEFRCKNEHYLRHPPEVTSNKCLISGNWSRPKPCCVRE